jgi:four helix bundle protein
MRNESILKQKSYVFALAVIQAYRDIVNVNKEYVLSKQFVRSGTAIGALIREAEFAQSRALKESNETDYWISLLKDSAILNEKLASKLEDDNKELISMLVSSIKTAKGK